MRAIGILLLLFLLLSPVKAMQTLSDQSKVYLLTCSPGQELYAIFGHSAIRVQDEANKIDLVFNYGTFDFMTPNFYMKFMNGRLDYMLSVSRFGSFVSHYEGDNRGVRAHLLDLTDKEKQQVWDFLNWNMQPENRFYRYDFFFDNCATRIRDLFFKVKGIEPGSFDQTGTRSYRDYLHQYLEHSPWTAQGIDLIIGLKADAGASPYHRAFLPDYLDSLLMAPAAKGLVLSTETVVPDVTLEMEATNITPLGAGMGLLFIYLLITALEWHRRTKWVVVDRFLLLLTGLCGLLMAYLWFFTDHSVTGWNMNLMWAMPTNLVLLFVLKATSNRRWLRFLPRMSFILAGLVFCCGYFFPQDLPSLVYPVALTLMVRLWHYCHWQPKFNKQNTNQTVVPKHYGHTPPMVDRATLR